MKRRFLSIILCLAMLIGTLPIYVTADETTDTQNDEIQTYAGAADPDPNGDGTVETPYLITSASELMWFRDKVNNGESGISARLMSDIVFNEDVNAWTPIGSAANPYIGSFDGNNYSIKNSSENAPWHMDSEQHSGLFDYIGELGAIKNLNISLYVDAKDDTSLLSHENKGTIEECTVKAILVNSEAVGADKTFSSFAYTNNGTIKNCLSILMANYQNACGFAAVNSGTIENSLCHFSVKKSEINMAYAIAKDTTGDTVTNCYCICSHPHTDFVKDAEKVILESIYSLTSYNDKKADYMKKLAWKLNNGSATESSNTDPWRYGTKSDGDPLDYPTLNPTDQKVLISDGSQTETPHTHRVDGVIREFKELPRDVLLLDEGDDGCYYLYEDEVSVNGWEIPANITLCLNGHSIENRDSGSIEVSNGINFTVTDCHETAGKITSQGNAGVTVKNGGTFVLDNVSISGCNTGIDYQGGTVKLSGKAKVTDNNTNIKLSEGQKLTFGILDESAHFGVTYGGQIAVGGEVEITDRTGVKYAQQLSSDNENYVLANGGGAVVLKNPEEHSHCICGAEHKEIIGTNDDGTKTGHTAAESVVFKPWNPNSHRDSENRPTLPTSEGSYYLTEDADLKDGTWEPNGDVKLCLNGYTVKFDYRTGTDGRDFGTIWLDDAADNLTVTDCGQTGTITMKDEKQNCVRITEGAEFNLYNGTMKGFERAVSIGDVSDLYPGYGTFNMYGGTLTENSYNVGAAVYANHADAKVNMYDGKITNNKTAGVNTQNRFGGGVCVQRGGSFTMYGGEISNNGTVDTSVTVDKQNGAALGGGVYVKGTFKMYGGKITGNTVTPHYVTINNNGNIYPKLDSAYGGGVYVNGSLTITGGEITNNKLTKGYGGGVYIDGNSAAVIKNATISGNTIIASQEYQSGNEPLNSDGSRYYRGGIGGGIYSNPELTLKNSKIENNSLTNPTVDNNKYGGGAGVYVFADTKIDGCTISGNTMKGRNIGADSDTSEPIGATGGAGVCVPGGNLTIKDSDIIGNKATSDSDAGNNRKLASGGVLFCEGSKTFTVSGKVNISGNTVDNADGNVYLEKRWNGSDLQKQQTTIWVGELDNASKIGVIARSAEDGDVQVAQINSADGTIPDDVFTSDDDNYKAVLTSDKRSVTLSVNNDVAEVIHSDGTKTPYENLWAAIEEAQDGETVKVLKDCRIDNGRHNAIIDKNITLDLNGKTVRTDELIYISTDATNVTIKNGTIYGSDSATDQQKSGNALITFQPNGNTSTLTLDSVTINKDEKSTLAVAVNNGKLIAKGGSIDGGLRVNSFGDAELSDITITKDEKDTALGDDDGVVFDMKGEDGGIARFLKSGYAYKKADDSFIDISDNPTSIPIGTTVTVSECTAHSFESGKCKYCGYVCTHLHANNWKCTDCNIDAVAMHGNNEAWFFSLDDAFAPIAGEQPKMVTLRNGTHTLSKDITISSDIRCNFADTSGAGNIIQFEGDHSFVVKSGGFLGLGDKMHISKATVEEGGGFGLEPTATVDHLILKENCTAFTNNKLGQGNFSKIVIQSGDKKVGDVVNAAFHKTIRHKGDDGTWATGAWATDEELNGQSIENVSIVDMPFYDETLTAANTTVEYGNTVTLTVKKTDNGDYTDSTTYKWYSVQNDVETEIAKNVGRPDVNIISGLKPGEYTFKCKITRGGYTRTAESGKVTVDRGTQTYEIEPSAIENLVYTGSSQKLANPGKVSKGQTNNIIKYSLDGQNWSYDLPYAVNAGKYNVHYKVDETEYYKAIPEKNFEVTIAPRVITGIETNNIVKKYDGKTALPTNLDITKFIDNKGNEINWCNSMWSGSYDSATAGENKNVKLTVTLIDGNNVFEDGKTEKVFDLTGTIEKSRAPEQTLGELTIIKKLKRDYTFDFSTLLNEIDGQSYGKITYSDLAVDIPDYYEDNATIDENGVLTLPIQASIGDGGTITVKVTAENYYNYYYDGVNFTDKDITLTVNVKAMPKIELIGVPTLNPTSITYGQKLSDITLSGSLKGVDDKTVEGTFNWKNPDAMPSAGDALADWDFTPKAEYYMYENGSGTVNFTVEQKDIAGARYEDFNLAYNGNEQTPTAKVTVDGMEVTGTWSPVTNVSDKTTFTASGNFKGTIENVETNMSTKDITNAQIALADSPVYNGSEQTQGVTSITVDGVTLGEGDYDISGNTATDVGEKTLSIQGKGNFSGNAEKKWSIRKKDYDGNKTASANVRYDKHMEIIVDLPEIPSGASYGTVKLSRAKNPDGTDYEYSIFPSGQRGVEGNKLYITLDPSRDGVYADITVPVVGATNYNDYDITIRVTCVSRREVTFGGVEDNQTFVYDGTAKAPNIDGLTVSDNVDKNTLEVKYNKVTESGTEDISANEITEVGTYKVTYSVPDTNNEFMGSITYTFAIEPKSVSDAVITLGESLEYNGSEQTQAVVSVKIGEMTLSESDYDISDNKATDVKADGSYVLTITGKGNFNGTKTAEWNLMPTEPTENADKKTTARVRRGRELSNATVKEGEILGIDQKAIKGRYAWVDDSKTLNSDSTEEMIFTPDSANYKPITVKVEVEAYRESSSGSSSSSGTTVSSRYMVNFNTNGGNTIPSQTVSYNQTATEPTQPTKGEFKFDGWYSDRELTKPYDFSAKVTKSITLYAKWLSSDAAADSDDSFNDVNKDDWYYDDVKSAVEKGLFTGTGDKTFAPNESITRAMFVTVLYRAEGEPAVDGSIPFTDVAANSYYANAVIWAAQNGVVKGVSETEFAPNDKITREQIAAMMHRYAKYKGYDISAGENTNILSYADFGEISDYAIEPMQYAVGGGLMKGKTENTLNPKDNATRAEIAAILNRFIANNK